MKTRPKARRNHPTGLSCMNSLSFSLIFPFSNSITLFSREKRRKKEGGRESRENVCLVGVMQCMHRQAGRVDSTQPNPIIHS